jgi:DMSO reductase family type II enzyme chaperone
MTPAIETALCRSAFYEALAAGFRPPSAEMLTRIASPEGAAGLLAAAGRLDPRLVPLVRRLAATARPPEALALEYRRLFGHTARGEVPLYDTEYGADDLFRQPNEIADVAGFYAAFGLVLAPGAGERPDHVSCECEFMMFLARKEAHALEGSDAALGEETRRAMRLFLRDHLGRFLPAVGARLERADPAGFYGALGALAARLVGDECARFGVEAGARSLGLRPAVEDRVPMACGSCPLGGGDAGDADGA